MLQHGSVDRLMQDKSRAALGQGGKNGRCLSRNPQSRLDMGDKIPARQIGKLFFQAGNLGQQFFLA
jgi:hypothetical protein